jgi:hypothetical protein
MCTYVHACIHRHTHNWRGLAGEEGKCLVQREWNWVALQVRRNMPHCLFKSIWLAHRSLNRH